MGIVNTIVTALTDMITGSVTAVTSAFQGLFFGTDGELSTLGTFMLVFTGIGCAVGLLYVVLNIFKKK